MNANAPRILQFCHGYDGPFLDCARQYVSLFQDTPYRVTTVFLTGAPSGAAIRESASDEVIFLEFSSAQIRGLKGRAILDIHRIDAARRFRFCIAHRFKPIYIALLATRLPVIGVHHAFGDYRRFSRRVFARLFRHRLALLGVSDAVRDDLRASLPAWPPERIETLHNRLDVDAAQGWLVSREQARMVLGLPPDAPIIANVGRLHPDKDQATLLEGFARALPHLSPETLLVIAGSGPLDGALKARAQSLGILEQTRFLGQIPNVRRFFRAFDLFVLSSDREPFGMVLLEAMAASVPVVATGCGGAPEVVGNPDQLFPLKDAKTLAERLTEFMTGEAAEARRRACAERGRQRLVLFTDEVARRNFFGLPMIRAIIKAKGQ
jgi:glycosyltransferase involved in cell wall biosynthesis